LENIMTRIAITGAAGRMGRTLLEAITATTGTKVTAAIELPGNAFIGKDAGELAGLGSIGVNICDSLEKVVNDFDVLIDFTAPEASIKNAEFCAKHGKKIVVGTTGLNEAYCDYVCAQHERGSKPQLKVVRNGRESIG